MRALVLAFVLGLVCAPCSVANAAQRGGEVERIDLQALVDATPDGGTLFLEPGTYLAPVVISRSITITGSHSAVVDSGGIGTVFDVRAADVTIDGLTIRGSGDQLDREHSGVSSEDSPRLNVTNNLLEDVLFGVFLRTSPDSVVSGNTIGSKTLDIARRGDGIRLWESAGSIVEANHLTGGRDLVFWFTDNIVVRDNVSTHGRYGLHFMYSDGAVVEGNVLSHNSVGAFLMYSKDLTVTGNVFQENYGPSGYGIGLKEVDDVLIENNRLVANRVGIYFDNTPSSIHAEGAIVDNLIAYNQIGALFLPSTERNSFSRNTFVDNAEQVGVTTTGRFTGNAWSVEGEGNYWNDYSGYDADGDGIGDVTHRVDDLYDTLTDRHPELRFFAETPAAKSIDIAARMFPVFRPDPLVEDVAPLVERPSLRPLRNEPAEAGPGPMLVAGLALSLFAVVLLAFPAFRRRRRIGAAA